MEGYPKEKAAIAVLECCQSGEDQERLVFQVAGALEGNNDVDLGNLLGEVLTLTEVILPESRQLEALKASIRTAFRKARIKQHENVYYISAQLRKGMGLKPLREVLLCPDDIVVMEPYQAKD